MEYMTPSAGPSLDQGGNAEFSLPKTMESSRLTVNYKYLLLW